MIRFRPSRPVLSLLLLALALSFGHAGPTSAATKDGKTSTQKKASSSKAQAKKPAARKSSAAKPAKAAKAAKPASQCRTVKVKTAQGTRNRKVCGSAPAAAAAAAPLASPITANALDRGPDSQPESRARSAPDRAYAVDGTSFFHQGRKFRVQGLENLPGDVATQRLQMALDSGAMTLEPVSVDDAGVTTAIVRVGGQNLADKLRPH